MTLDQLAQAMRGMPRDALIVVRTPEGLREVRLVKPCYVRVQVVRDWVLRLNAVAARRPAPCRPFGPRR